MQPVAMMCRSCRSFRHAQCIFFFFGVIIGITFGCTLTLMFTDWSTTYYYYTDGVAVELADTPSDKVPSIEIIKTSDSISRHSKRSENPEEIQYDDALVEIDEQNQIDPKDIPKWYDSDLISKLNPQASFKYDAENYLVHRKPVLVSVFIKNCNKISNVPLLLDTWGGTIDMLIFVSSDCAIPHNLRRTFMIQLPEMGLKVYPPQKRTFSILEYIFKKYGSAYNWFLLIRDENTYINVKYLLNYVNQLNYDEMYYIGNPKRLTIEELKRFELFQHEQFCQTRLGVLFSNNLLQKLTPLMDSCLNEYTRHYSVITDEDVELGRCISRKLGFQCWSGSKEENKLFYLDSEGELDDPRKMFKNNFFQGILSIHPINSDIQMHVVHFYYKVLEYNQTKQLVVSIGKTISRICQSLSSHFSSSPEVQKVFNYCSVDYKEELLRVTDQASSIFSPKGKHEVQTWNYFDSKSLYEDEAINPRKVLATYKHHKRELEDVLVEIVRLANLEHPSPLVFHNLINGYVRHNPMKGNEYIIDAEFTEINNPYIIVQRRFSLLRPLSTNYILQPSKNTIDELVTILVPISQVTKRLEEFFDSYEQIALRTNENTRLMLVVFGEDDINYCNAKINALSSKFPHSKFTIVQGSGEFARAKALDIGMRAMKKNNLVFICDVDVDIDQSFLNRCRRNTVVNKQVYYPEVFKWYNTNYVYKFKRKAFRQVINRDTGHWGHYSYGMLCIYQSDYIKVGGFDTRIVGWGGEDVKFYEQILKSDLQVIRAPDPGATHRWHEKKCVYTDSKRYHHCLMSKSEALADKRELARYIFEIEEKKSSERFFCL